MKPRAQSKAVTLDRLSNPDAELLIFGLAMTAMLGVMLLFNVIS